MNITALYSSSVHVSSSAVVNKVCSTVAFDGFRTVNKDPRDILHVLST